MAYKVSYKVVTEQGEQLKNTAKDMDNYVTQLNQIISKLGNDELLQSVRENLKKFTKQMEDEKTILNLAGQVLIDVVQSYTGSEKKSVQKVDKAKAHNRDFYKRPVVVASAGSGSASVSASSVTVNSVSNTASINAQTTNVFVTEPGTASVADVVSDTVANSDSGIGLNVASVLGAEGISQTGAVAGAAAALAAGGVLAGAAYEDSKSKSKNKKKTQA